MRLKMIPFSICIALFFTLGSIHANAQTVSYEETIIMDQIFQNEGLRMQVSVMEMDDSDKNSTLFKVKTKLTNLTQNPVPYIRNGCFAIHTTVYLIANDNKYQLRDPNPFDCPTDISDEILGGGESLQQTELFSTVHLPPGLIAELFSLSSYMKLGTMDKPENHLRLQEFFNVEDVPSHHGLVIDAKLSKKSKKYILAVQGLVKDPEIKLVAIQVEKSKYSVKIDKKTRKLALNRDIQVKGDPPETAIIEVIHKDGSRQKFTLSLKLDSTK